ncbi:hypothetical protein ACSBR1_031321 [Camellia fascicularis]
MPALEMSETSVHIEQKLDAIIRKITSESKQRVSEADDNFKLIARDPEHSYKQDTVRIGLNHGTDWYNNASDSKCRYLKSLVEGTNEETSLEVYVKAMEELVEEALKRYEQPTIVERGQYVKIMLVDSCFIIESFSKSKTPTGGHVVHNNKNQENIALTLQRDLIRIGNQLPFFVLKRFFNTAKDQGKYPNDQLIDLARFFFHNMVGPYDPRHKKFQHLLDLVYFTFCGPQTQTPDCSNVITITELEYMDYASELQEVGVKFNKNMGAKKFFDIKFENGVMEIPPLSDSTLSVLRNLMAYETQFRVCAPRRINDYAKFMQCLVNSPKDVKVLRRSGIIDNQLGNNEVITRLEQLGSEAQISNQFTYSQLLNDVKEHCRCWRKVWMADLWRNYIKSPWKFLSVLAALLLLSLTVTQTVFAILSYTHPPQPKM